MSTLLTLTRQDYTVAWLCALPVSEFVAAQAMLDYEHNSIPLPEDDENSYAFGSINGHNIVIACLPPGLPGKVSAGRLVQPLRHSFPNLKVHLFVGIGGGVPRNPVPSNPQKDIHLGDVVVGWAERAGVPGVVQWDFVRLVAEKDPEPLGYLETPDRRLLNALGLLVSRHALDKTKFVDHLERIVHREGWSHPGVDSDRLFKSSYVHEERAKSDCRGCDQGQLVERKPRTGTEFVFHQGTILSGDAVMKDAQLRDSISKQYHDAMCFEMEAAGVMDDKKCLVIRGIADYADSHKNHQWQKYAAATAASFAREFLYTLQPAGVPPTISAPIPSSPKNKLWFVRRKVNSLFLGRSELLTKIKQGLSPGSLRGFQDQQKIFVITGLGGQGKSETCLKVANMMREDFWGVFWVDVSSPSSSKADFTTIAKMIGHSANEVDDVLHLLANQTEEWLLILDNADEPDFDYQVYFPSGTRGSIILTSRNPECFQYATVGSEAIDGLNSQDAIELILKAAKVPETLRHDLEPTAKDIVNVLGHHTLALIQAGSYISRGYCSLDRYLDEYDRQRLRVLKFVGRQEASRYGSVYATFESAIAMLNSINTTEAYDAFCLLNLISMISYRDIPIQIFEEAYIGSEVDDYTTDEHEDFSDPWILWRSHVSMLPEFIQKQTGKWDPYPLRDAMNLLVSLALIDLSNNFISMHPLAHTWARERQSMHGQIKPWESAGSLLAFSSYPASQWQVYDFQLLLQLRDWLELGITMIPKLSREARVKINPIIIQLVHKLSLFYEKEKALEYLEAFFDGNGEIAHENSRFRQAIDLTKSSLLGQLGREEEAIQILGAAITRSSLEENSHGLIEAEYELAWVYQSCDRHDEAIKHYGNVDRLEASLSMTDTDDNLMTQIKLSKSYLRSEQIDEAIRILEHTTREWQSAEEYHGNRLGSESGLACAYIWKNSPKKAIPLLQHVIKVQSTWPHDDIQRLWSEYLLASAYHRNRQWDESIKLLEQFIGTRSLTLDGTYVLFHSQLMLAVAYRQKGQFQSAMGVMEPAVHRYWAQADEFPRRVRAEYELAVTYEMKEQNEKAITLMERVVRAKMNLEAANSKTAYYSPTLSIAQEKLAALYHKGGRNDEAAQLLEAVEQRKRRTLREHESSLIDFEDRPEIFFGKSLVRKVV